MADKQQTRFDELAAWMAKDQQSPPLSIKQLIDSPNGSLPIETELSDALGSRRSGNVILHTGQLHYCEELIELAGRSPLFLRLHYTSRSLHAGSFGQHWQFEYENRLEETILNNERAYRLHLRDGRCFEFPYDRANNCLLNTGNLAADIHWKKNEQGYCFIVNYYDGRTETYQHDRLIEQSDAEGNILKLDYNEQGQLSHVYNNADAYLALTYGDNQLVSQISDQSNRTWQFNYNKNNTLKSIVTPSKAQRHYRYQTHQEEQSRTSQLLTLASDSTGQAKIKARYDDNGRVATIDQQGASYRYTYTQPNSINKQNVQSEQEHLYHLNQYGLIDSIHHPDNTAEYLQWNHDKQTAHITHRSEAKETQHYDQRHRLIETLDGSQGTGETTTYHYQDNSPHPSKIKSPEGTSRNQYDAQNRLLSRTDEQGRTESYQYDERGSTTAITDSEGNTTTLQHNKAGQPIKETDALGSITHAQYDKLGRHTQLIDANGKTTTLSYDANDNITCTTDPLGKSTHFSYNTESQLISITDPAGNTTGYAYDDMGRLSIEQRSNHNPKNYHYNSQGRLERTLREDGSSIYYLYDDNGKLKTETIYSADKQEKLVNHYQHDNKGRLTQAKNTNSTSTFTYTAAGQIETQQQDELTVERAYDRNDKLVHLGYLDQSIQYQRDKHGNLHCIRQNHEKSIEQQQNNHEQLTQRHYPNNTQESIQYNDIGQITELTTANQTIPYKSDAIGNITQKGQISYQYDDAGQLIRTADTLYHYDKAGNLRNKSTLELPTEAEQTNTQQEPEYPTENQTNKKNNQLTENQSHTFTYDQRGNLSSKTHKAKNETLYYHYNLRNQLIKIKGYNVDERRKCTLQIDTHYQYDALGRRIQKKQHGIKTRYLYDKLNIIAIADYNEAGKINEISTLVHDERIDTPLSITHKGQSYYYHRDHQGSIIALSDKDGNIVEEIDYDHDYGNIISHTKTAGQETNNPYGYTGREIDSDDLYYYRARYYDPQTQRFLSEDPIGLLSGDTNYYRYVENSPQNLQDPFGLAGCGKEKGKLDKAKKAKKKIAKKAGVKAAKSAARKAVAIVAVVADGPLPVGDVFAAGLMIYDVWDMWGSADELIDAITDLADAEKELKECKAKKAKEGNNGNTGKGNADKKKCDTKARKNKSRHRPSFRKNTVKDVWNNAKNAKGEVWDPRRKFPSKYPPLKLPDWTSGESRIGKWDMGHSKPKYSWKKLRKDYINCKKTWKQVLDDYNDPKKYRPEDPSRNRARVDGW